jgi:hypothetical protein
MYKHNYSKGSVMVASKRTNENKENRIDLNTTSYIVPELTKHQNLKSITKTDGNGTLEDQFSYGQIED